ncbi:hypothetical protein ACFL0Q_00900 [Thermodesulfobacteriota bacterium]
MRQKKITRKELLKKPDEFITFTSRLVQFAVAYRRQLYAAGGLAVAIVVVLSGVRYLSARSEKKAQALYAQAQSALSAGQEEAGEKALTEAAQKLEEILNEYRRTSAARLAAVEYAHVCVRRGDLDKAIEWYERSLAKFEKDVLIKSLVKSSLAHAYLGKSDHRNAARLFEDLARSQEDVWKEDAYIQLASLYDALGEVSQGETWWRKLAEEFPDSLYHSMASERVSTLEASRKADKAG